MSRNLTYLGSPYKQGEGTAAILPKGDVGAAFLDSMRGIKKQQQEQKQEKEKAKQKAWDYYKISKDLHLSHEGMFSQRVKDLMDEMSTEMANNPDFDLSDSTNPKVQEFRSKMGDIHHDAGLSNTIKKMSEAYDKVVNDPAKSAKLTNTSKQRMADFFSKPLSEQLEAYKNGTAPRIEMRVPIPEKEINSSISNINAGLNNLYSGQTEERLKEETQKRRDILRTRLETTLTPSMFDEYPKPEEAMEAYIEQKVNEIKQPMVDKKADRELAVKEEKQRMAREKYQRQLRQETNLAQFVKGIADGSDAMITKGRSLVGKYLVDSGLVTNAKEFQIFSGMEFTPNPNKPGTNHMVVGGQVLRPEQLPTGKKTLPRGKYVIMRLSDNSYVPFRTHKPDGSVDTKGMTELKEFMADPYNQTRQVEGVVPGALPGGESSTTTEITTVGDAATAPTSTIDYSSK